jgi:hypothetical protein
MMSGGNYGEVIAELLRANVRAQRRVDELAISFDPGNRIVIGRKDRYPNSEEIRNFVNGARGALLFLHGNPTLREVTSGASSIVWYTASWQLEEIKL